MNEERLKNRIKAYRALKDWTQEELAKQVGVARKTINSIETGRFVPSTTLSLRLAKVLSTSVEALFALPGDEFKPFSPDQPA
jgi:putative transcriptional regulator